MSYTIQFMMLDSRVVIHPPLFHSRLTLKFIHTQNCSKYISFSELPEYKVKWIASIKYKTRALGHFTRQHNIHIQNGYYSFISEIEKVVSSSIELFMQNF